MFWVPEFILDGEVKVPGGRWTWSRVEAVHFPVSLSSLHIGWVVKDTGLQTSLGW